MILRSIFVFVATLLIGVVTTRAQSPTKSPEPTPEHQWLKQLVGEWETEMVAPMPENKTMVIGKGTEITKSIGGFWILAEETSETQGQPFTSVFTLGYDPAKKKFLGTSIESLTDDMLFYEGELDPKKSILMLQTEVTHPKTGEKNKIRLHIQMINKDHKVVASSALTEDGKWINGLATHFRRKNSTSPRPN